MHDAIYPMILYKAMSLSICVLALILTALLVGIHIGFDFGERQGRESIYLSLTPEGELAKFYVRIWIGLLGCLLGQFVRRALISSIISFCGLVFVFYSNWLIYGERMLSYASMERVTETLRFVYVIDIANGFLSFALATLLVFDLLRHRRRDGRDKENVRSY